MLLRSEQKAKKVRKENSLKSMLLRSIKLFFEKHALMIYIYAFGILRQTAAFFARLYFFDTFVSPNR